MKTATATSAWLLDEGNRLDASFHLSDGRIARALFQTAPYPVEPLSKLTTEIFSGPRFRRYYVSSSETGIPFLSGSDIVKADFNATKLISNKMTNNLEALKVEKGWTLVTRSGTIGLTAFTNDDFLGKALTEDVIRIIPNEERIESGYLYTFLASKFGYALLTQFNYGGVIKHIEPHHITDLPIPLLPERQRQEIHGLIEEAARLRVEGNGLLSRAIKMIEGRLPQLEFQKYYSASASIFQKQRMRIDATAQIEAIEKFFKKAEETAKLETVYALSKTVFTPGIFKRIRVNNSVRGIPFLSGINLLEAKPKFDSFLSRKMPNLSDYLLKEGWLAIQDSGSITSMGYVSMIPKFLDGMAATNNLIRVVPKEENANPYILAFLKTEQAQKILKSLPYGTGQLHIDDNQIGNLPIPIFQDIFETVKAMVVNHSNNFNEAFEMETKAITILENEISSWQPSKQPYTAMLR
jgi:restriction endonuclease S subunit